MSDDKPINPFAAALSRPCNNIVVSLSIPNVLTVRPDWDEARALKFLSLHAELIAHAMLTMGMQMIANLAEQNDAN